MGDDLAAFFAKKSQKKSKKKNIVSLDDVGQQLERKVKIQETGEPDFDEVIVKEHAESAIKIQPSNEDSEWIECIEKPSIIGINFKELTDHPDDLIEEEKKNANSETNKTWNIIDKKEKVAEEIVVKAPTKYQAPGNRRTAPLDLNNQAMFPSIADADEIAGKLKADEKKKLAAGVPAEDRFDQVENKKINRDVYRAPNRSDGPNNRTFDTSRSQRSGHYDSSFRNNGDRSEWSGANNRRTLPSDNSDSITEFEGNWRDGPRKNTSTTAHSAPAHNYSHSNRNNSNANESFVSKADESSNWRSGKQRTTAPPQTPSTAATNNENTTNAPTEKKYVPPFLRNK